MVKVKIKHNVPAVRFGCVVCGGSTEKADYQAVLDVAEKEYTVCGGCLQAGSAAIPGRLHKHAAGLEADAMCLRELAAEQWELPTDQEWAEAVAIEEQTANDRYGYIPPMRKGEGGSQTDTPGGRQENALMADYGKGHWRFLWEVWQALAENGLARLYSRQLKTDLYILPDSADERGHQAIPPGTLWLRLCELQSTRGAAIESMSLAFCDFEAGSDDLPF
jgi:hypothetical protein